MMGFRSGFPAVVGETGIPDFGFRKWSFRIRKNIQKLGFGDVDGQIWPLVGDGELSLKSSALPRQDASIGGLKTT